MAIQIGNAELESCCWGEGNEAVGMDKIYLIMTVIVYKAQL